MHIQTNEEFRHNLLQAFRPPSGTWLSLALQLGLEVSSAVLTEQVCVHAVPPCHLEAPLIPHLHA